MAGMPDDVADGQEIGLVQHLPDEGELVADQFGDLFRNLSRISRAGPLPGQPFQRLRHRLSGNAFVRIIVL